jgi:uncharacterized membrane protein YfcA
MIGSVFIGLMSGFFAGLIGIGGGFIFVPLIMSFYPYINIHKAVATSSGFAVVAGISSFISHISKSSPYWNIAGGFLIGSFAGALAGPHIALMIPESILAKLFAAVVVLPSAMRLMQFTFKPVLPYIIACGLVVGCFSSIFGIGGGILLMPILVQAFNLDIRRAVTTSALFIAVNSTVATCGYAFRGYVQWDILLLAAPAGVLGAWMGSKVSHRIKPVYIKVLLVLLTLGIIIRMLLE